MSRNIASLCTSSKLINVRFASNVTRVGDEVSDVTSVNTVLQQCTGKVVRLKIRFEITYSTTVVEFNTTMALGVLMERDLSRGSALILHKRALWSAVKKLDCKTYD
jgi:hypothetical protein